MAELLTPERFLEALKEERSFPGLYDYIFVMDGVDKGSLCCKCIHDEEENILANLRNGETNVYLCSSADYDPDTIYCDACGKDMSAYEEEQEDFNPANEYDPDARWDESHPQHKLVNDHPCYIDFANGESVGDK